MFLIKPYFDMIENSRQKFSYHEREKSFYSEKRVFSFQKLYLKSQLQIQLAFHPFDPFLINNRNMTRNSVEK